MTRPGKQEVPVKRQFECEKNVLIRFSGHPKPDLEVKKSLWKKKEGLQIHTHTWIFEVERKFWKTKKNT